jgi:hypothetical protein
MEWQPIETAPRDQVILVYGNPRRGDQGEFGQRIAVAKHSFDYQMVNLGSCSFFVYADGRGMAPDKCIIPSHWMPLPKPLEEKE